MTIFGLKITIFIFENMKRGSFDGDNDANVEDNEDEHFLRAECRRRGISSGGSVAVLQERIRRHRAGEGGVLLKKPRNLVAFQPGDEGARTSIAAAPREARHYTSNDGFLGIPREVLRTKILPFVVGTLELFALARSCKYLYNDCLAEITCRARHVFGAGKSTSTPMALHLLMKLQNTTENIFKMTGYRETEEERRVRALKTMGLGHIDEKEKRIPPTTEEVRKMREHCRLVSIAEYPEYRAILTCILEKRSVEQAYVTKMFATAQAEAKKSETTLVASMKQQRLVELSRAMFDAKGGDDLFVLSPEGDSVGLSPKGKMVFDMFGIEKYKQCCTFILKAAPSTGTVISNLHKEYPAFKAYGSNGLRCKALNCVLEAAYRRVEADPTCAMRLSVWLAACFSPHSTYHGALCGSELTSLSQNYIDSLVAYIAATDALPVTQDQLHPENNDTIRVLVLFPGRTDYPADYCEFDCTFLAPFQVFPYADSVRPAGFYTTRYWQKSHTHPLGVVNNNGKKWEEDRFEWRTWYGSVHKVQFRDAGCMPLTLICDAPPPFPLNE